MKKIFVLLLLAIVTCSTLDARVKRKETKAKTPVATTVTTSSAPSIDTTMVKDLLISYVDLKTADRDASRALERLKSVYDKQSSAIAKSEFRDVIYRSLINYQKANKNLESLAAIDAYQAIASLNDSNLPAMMFVKGDISAHVLNDTLILKDCIAELSVCDKTSKTSEYITKLRTYLQEIRDYVPVCDRLGTDFWVSVNYLSKEGLPAYIIQADYGSPESNVRLYYGKSSTLGVAQNQTELMNDCAYYAWSDEKLDIPSNLSVTLRNSVSAEVGNLTSSALSDALGSSFLGSIGGDLVGGILGSLFKQDPKKIINICEATVHMVNDFEMEANFKIQSITITQDKQNKEEINHKPLFLRISPDVENKLIGDGNKFVGSDLSKVMKALSYDEDKELVKIWKKRLTSDIAKKQWNVYQLAQLYDQYERMMKEENIPCSRLHHNKYDHNSLGVELQNLDENPKIQKKYPNIKGLYVKEFHEYGTAAIYGIKKGDVILSIDGYKMNSMDNLDYIRSLERFSPVKVKVLRDKKEIDIDVEHIGLFFGYRED